MTNVTRFLVLDESQRNRDCSPGAPTSPLQYHAELAEDTGAALGMPSAAQTTVLEQCSLNEFALWQGSWRCFLQRTADWTEQQRQTRVHRLALLDDDRSDEEERVELIRPAFSLPYMARFNIERGQIGGYIYGRRDIVSLLALKSTEFRETEHYRIVYAEPDLTLPQLIATYLRQYWEALGQ